jgi:hypothetical protein
MIGSSQVNTPARVPTIRPSETQNRSPDITIARTVDGGQPGALARIHIRSVSAAGDSGRP